MRSSSVVAVVTALVLLTGCGDSGLYIPGLSNPDSYVASAPEQRVAAAPAAMTRADGVLAARRCGKALGVAARCNLVRDDRDFAVLRFAVLQGLDRRYGQQVGSPELAELLDLATLDRMTTIGSCAIPDSDLPRVADGVRSVVDSCARP